MQGEKETAHFVRKGVAVLLLFFLFFTENKAHFVKITDSNLEMITLFTVPQFSVRSLRSEISKLV